MLYSFFRTSFVLAIFLATFTALGNFVFNFLHLAGLANIFSWVAPALLAFVYTIFFYKERFSTIFKLSAIFYSWLLLSIPLIILAIVKPEVITHCFSFNTISSHVFHNLEGQEAITMTYLWMLLRLPFSFAWSYFSLKIGNRVGRWLVSEKKHSVATN